MVSGMYCNKCGNKIEGDLSFCPNCGNKLLNSVSNNMQIICKINRMVIKLVLINQI